MGTLRSTNTDVKGHAYNGVVFGEPVETEEDPAVFEFDHQAFPNGTVELTDGEVVVVVDVEEMDES
jgi:hypothetical protein